MLSRLTHGILLACFLTGFPGSASGTAPKKVYADYHGVRYTREHDGKLGRWSMYAHTEASATGRRTICHNADNILPGGGHDIAAVDYPMAGMQSGLDPDFIEYQILTAKAGGIDGFFVEWGFFPHENHDLLRAMQRVAGRYGFEIGVNWCDQWLYYDWITQIHPEVATREEKTDYFARCYQLLIDSVLYGVATAPLVRGRPVFYLFCGAVSPEEYLRAEAQLRYPEGQPRPGVLRRWAEWGTLDGERYVSVRHTRSNAAWSRAGLAPTAWIPARIRPRDAGHPLWDYYGTPDDAVAFMEPFRDSVWNVPSRYPLRSGFVMPGMDNGGCAGWGHQHYYHISRDEGDTYRRLWEFTLESRDSLDMILIASWNDYTEGHEIEPTLRRGYREMETTLKYASEFKGVPADPSGLPLPLKLFRLRRQVKLWEDSGGNGSGYRTALDTIARQISRGEYARAHAGLTAAEEEIRARVESIPVRPVRLKGEEITTSVRPCRGTWRIVRSMDIDTDPSLRKILADRYYKGAVTFSYRDDGYGVFRITSETRREPVSDFRIVGEIRRDNSGRWKPARIELFARNIGIAEGRPLLSLEGKAEIRDLALEFDIYRP
jgi:hypothetical protein